MNVVVTGSNGQLGSEFKNLQLNDIDWVFLNSNELDITNNDFVRKYFKSKKTDLIINCAAFTNVDGAEENIKQAILVNKTGVQNLVEICSLHGIKLIHYSTDYVFDGQKKGTYTENDKANPQTAYGKSKYEAETAIQESNPKHIILRTSWVYSLRGKNFLTTILGMAKNKESFSIVFDQTGSPSSAIFIANAILEITKKIEQVEKNNLYGLYNLTCSGSTSWFDFAKTIILYAEEKGLNLKSTSESIKPIKTSEFTTLASRPKNSRLNNQKLVKTFEINCPEWQNELKLIMSDKVQEN